MSDSEDESVPPDPQGEAVDAAHLPQAAGVAGAQAGAAPPAQHPVWAAAAGRSASKGKPDAMYGPISMMELEIRGRCDLDGGSSTASVRGDKESKSRRRGKEARAKPKKRPREYDDDDDDDGDGDEDADVESSASMDMAGAAFGGATVAKGRVACASEASDDGISVSSSVVRRRHERAFPITGVTCVGCALPSKIQPVTDFIAKNMSSMAELALYKMAALVYKTKVADPAEEEGVDVPAWGARICTNRVPCARSRHVALRTRRLEGDPRALPAALGLLAHAALRKHPHALGDAQDPRDAASAPRPGDGRADARQEQCRGHHEDHCRQQPRADAARGRKRYQEARVKPCYA